MIFGTVWCVPSQRESMDLERVITDVYGSRGLRVILILTDGATRGAGITRDECSRWAPMYGLSTPVLVDSGSAMTNVYTPEMTVPASYLLDGDGVIRYQGIGAATENAELFAALDALLR